MRPASRFASVIPAGILRILRGVAENRRLPGGTRRLRRRRQVTELLEPRELLSVVTPDHFTLVESGQSGVLNVLHERDWDAEAAPEWLATFGQVRVLQTAGSNQNRVADNFVAVDTSKTYGLSGWARSGDNFGMRFSPTNLQSFGVEEYDADYLKIEPEHVLKFSTATDTTLRSPLSPGDTQVLLTSVTGWSNSGDSSTRALAWFGHTNSAGLTYPDFSYTRNVATGGATGLWNAGGINIGARIITLNAPWSGPLLPTGTAVRNAVTSVVTDAMDHSAIALNRQAVPGDFTPTEYAALIGGGTFANGVFQSSRFAPGTAFVRPVIQANQHGLTDNFVTWQDIRILELPSTATLQDVRQPVIDLSLDLPGNQTVRLPLYSTGETAFHIGTEARIQVSASQRYQLTVDSLDMTEEDLNPVGFYSYDADGRLIHSLHVTRHATAVDTRLARAVQPGDAAIYVNDATGWSNAIVSTAESRSLAWYGYRDSSGTLYADYTYTRNVAFDMMDGLWDVGGITFDSTVGAWKITLRNAWSGPTIASGTAVRNATGHDEIQLLRIPTDRFFGSDYISTPSGGWYQKGDNLDWTNYSRVIGGGVWLNGTPADAAFRPGTKFIQPAIKAMLPQRFAVEFGPTADQGLEQQQTSVTFGEMSYSLLNRSRQWIESDQLIPVSPDVPTILSVDAASGTTMNSGATSSEVHSIGYVPVDADGLKIESLHVRRYSTAVDTTLSQALRLGDTQIVLSSTAGWSNVDVAGTRAIAWYGYRDSLGQIYGDYTYTRNVAADVVNGLWDLGAISGNVITLRQPWAGPTLAAGIAVRNAMAGDDLIPVLRNEAPIPNQWTKYSATLFGTWSNGVPAISSMPPGTASLRVAVRANENNFAADDVIHIRNAAVTKSSGQTATLQDSNVVVATLDVLANDAVTSGNVSLIGVSSPRFGTAEIVSGGGALRDTVRYQSSSWFAGTDQFTYTVRNHTSGTTWTTTATVTITADNLLNDPSRASSIAAQVQNPSGHAAPPVQVRPQFPWADQAQTYSVEQGQTLVANNAPLTSLKNTATDADADVLTYRLVSGPSHGALLFRADGTFEYTPENSFVGTDSFEYLVSDGLTSLTRSAAIRTWKGDYNLLNERMLQIARAFHDFHDTYNYFGLQKSDGTASRFLPNGMLKLSWRVYLLPFLGYSELFEKFRLSETWDSPNNLPLLSQMPDVYRSLGDLASTTSTRFQIINDLQDLGSSTTPKKYLFRTGYYENLASIRDFTDGLQNSILFLQTGADVAVPWTASLDVDHDPANPFGPLGTTTGGRINVAMADGQRISFSKSTTSAATFHAMVTISGGELIDGTTLGLRDAELNPGPRMPRTASGIWTEVSTASSLLKLKELGLAMHNFHDVWSRFPSPREPYNFDTNGRPNLSWRVELLRKLGYENLYWAFDHTQPWNSPHNLALIDQMPDIFRSVGDPSNSTTSRFHVLSGPDAAFGRDWVNGVPNVSAPKLLVGPTYQDFRDGISNTLLIAELGTDKGVPWTAPDEVIFDPQNIQSALGNLAGAVLPAVLADGTVLELGVDLFSRELPALVSRDKNEVNDGWGLIRLETSRRGGESGAGTRLKNQLKLVGLAMHNYHAQHNRLPVFSDWRHYGPDGRPFLSWRVHLLPYIEQSVLYSQFRLNEPWDSPHNIQLLDKMPTIYRSTGDASDSTTTRIQVFTGPEALFERTATGNFGGTTFLGPRIQQITDGTSNTFLAIEAGESKAVPWTKPDDLEFDPNDPLGTMGLSPDDVFTAVLADGSVRQISAGEVQSVLKALITPAGGEYGGYPFGTPATKPEGSVLPGITVTGTTDARLVISEGKLGAIHVVLDKPGSVQIDVALSVNGVVLADKSTLTFTTSNWSVPQAVTLKAIDDDLIDGSESVILTLSINDTATTTDAFDSLPDVVVPVFNVNDDVPSLVVGPGQFSLTEGQAGRSVSLALSHPPSGNVTVGLSVADPQQISVSTSAIVFTPSNWNVPQTVTVSAVDDLLADGVVTSSLTFSVTSGPDAVFRSLHPAIITADIADNEVPELLVTHTGSDTVVSEDGLTDSLSVQLAVQPIGDVIVAVTASDSTEVSTAAVLLTFTPSSWNVAQSVIVSGVNDVLADGDQLSDVRFTVSAQSSTPYLTAGSKTVVVRTIDDEAALLILAHTDGGTIVSESGSSDTFAVRLSQQPLGDVLLRVESAATSEVRVENSTLTFTPANWNQPQPVTVTGVDDSIADGPQTISVSVSVMNGTATPFRLALTQSINVQVTDNEVAAVVVTPSDGSTIVSESGTTDTVLVTLSAQPVGTVVVRLAASRVSEFTVSPASLTFSPANWNVPQTATVTGVDDAVADGTQSATLDVSVDGSQSAGGFATPSPAVSIPVTILDNELASFVVTHTSGATVVSESGASDQIGIRLTSQPTGSVTVRVTATDPSEVRVTTNVLTFTATNWNVEQLAAIAGVDDVLADGLITSTLTIASDASSAGGYAAGVPVAVNVQTTDNDVPGLVIVTGDGSLDTIEGGAADSFTVALAVQPIGTVVIELQSLQSDEVSITPGTLSFTSANWNVPQTVFVTAVDDVLADGTRTSSLQLTSSASQSAGPYAQMSSVTLSMTSRDNETPSLVVTETDGTTRVREAGNSDIVTVRLSAPPISSVDIEVASLLMSEVVVSPVLLTFTPTNWNQPQTVTVYSVDDAVADGDQLAEVRIRVAGTSPVNWLAASPVVVQAINTDNESPAIVIQHTAGSTAVTENRSTDVFGVVLSVRPTGDVVLDVRSLNSSEISVNPVRLTFTPQNWNVAQNVTVTGIDDSIADGDQSAAVEISVDRNFSHGGYHRAATVQAVAVNRDNEVAGWIVSETDGTTVVSESGTTDTISVRLSVQPTSPVQLQVISSATSEVVVQSAPLTFSPANWNVPQSVILSGQDDQLADGDQSTEIRVSVADGSSPAFLSVPPVSLTARTIDNESAAIVVAHTDNGTRVSEDGTTDVIQVSLSTQPVTSVTLLLSSVDAGEVSVAPTQLLFTSQNWNVPQSVTVTGINDSLADGDQISRIRVSPHPVLTQGPYNSAAPAEIAVTTTDNESAVLLVTESAGSTVVSERRDSDTIQIRLSSLPIGPVQVIVSVTDSSEVSVSPQIVTFSASNWSLLHTITVTGLDDDIVDGPLISTVRLQFSSDSAGTYSAAPAATVSVTTQDNEIPALVVTETDGNTQVSETGTSDSVGIRLNAAPTAAVVISVESSDPQEFRADRTQLTFDPSNWSVPQTIVLTGTDDSATDGVQIRTLRLRVAADQSQPEFTGLQRDVSVTVFDDEMTVPVILEPAASTSTLSPLIRWTPVPGATKYQVWVSRRGSSLVALIDTIVTGTEFTATQLPGIGDYSVWVRASLNNGTPAGWSPVRDFRINTAVRLHSLPRFVNSLKPTISWHTLPGAAKYDLWVSNKKSGQSQVIRQTALTSTSYTPALELPLGLYVAWVRGIDAAGQPAAWSAGMEFHTAATPQQIAPLAPTFNRRPEFRWTAVNGADSYDLIYRNKVTLVESRVTEIRGTSWTPPSDLVGGTHDWWVRARSAAQTFSIWSPTGIFDVGGRPILQPVTLNPDGRPVFQWSAVDGAARYILQVDRLDVAQSRVIREPVTGQPRFVGTAALPAGSYRAWVQAISSSGTLSAWSLHADFVMT